MEGFVTTKQTVTDSVQEDNAFFKQMLDFIPVSFYFSKDKNVILAGETENESDEESEEEEDNKNNKKPVIKRKKIKVELAPEEKLRRKKAKFDTEIPQTVTQVQEHIFSKPTEQTIVPQKKKRRLKTPGGDEGEDDEDSIRSSTDTREELRERLQARIDDLKVKRKALDRGDSLEKKKLKRRQSKMQLKLKKKKEKQNKNKAGDPAPAAPRQNGLPEAAHDSPSKPIYNKDGKMVFSKFDFSASGKDKKKHDVPTGKNYKKLLEHVTKEKEKIKTLKMTDEKKAKELENKKAWKTALAKAEGVKVKDNPEMLKKSIKRKDDLKKRGDKKWQDRSETLEKKMKDKQDKRKKNLRARRDGVKDKKLKKMKKKGHIIPGF